MTVCLVAGCSENDPTLLAKVGDHVITTADLADRQIALGQAAPSDLEVLEMLINEQVLVNRAESIGLDQTRSFKKARNRLLLELLNESDLQPKLASVELSEDQREAYYSANKERFKRPEQRRFAIIHKRIGDGFSEDAVLAELREIRKAALELTEGEGFFGFGELASRHSDDLPSRQRGGDIGWATEGVENYRWGAVVNQAAFGLSALGDVSEVIESKRGYFLVRLIDLRGGGNIPIEDVSSSTWRRLLDRKRQELRDSIIEKWASETEIKRFPNRL